MNTTGPGSRSHYKAPHQKRCGRSVRTPLGELTRTKAMIAAAFTLWEARQGITTPRPWFAIQRQHKGAAR